MTEKQKLLILNMVEQLFDDEGALKEISKQDFLLLLNSVAMSFDLAVIQKSSPAPTEEQIVLDILNAINFMERIGKKPTIKEVSKIINKKQETTRGLMIKYNIYDPFRKKIKQSLSMWG